MRVGIIGIQHESNTFIREPTTFADFEAARSLGGEAIRESLQDTNHEVAGFFEGLAAAGLEAVPIYFAMTLPSGAITAETAETLVQNLLDGLSEAGPLDGIRIVISRISSSQFMRDRSQRVNPAARRLIGAVFPTFSVIDSSCGASSAMRSFHSANSELV